jgi:hypothetical protein
MPLGPKIHHLPELWDVLSNNEKASERVLG